jgi:cyclophilin family peptidyl-prolyl cis-trans isomerase
MANKKKIEERNKAQKAKDTEKAIRWVGAGILVLVLAGLVWLIVSRQGNDLPDLSAPVPGEVVDTSVPTPTVDVDKITPIAFPTEEPAFKQYDEYPPMAIDTTKKYLAKFVMEKGGEFTVELYADKAPKTVNSFVFLSRDGFYDGVTFHRVLEGFMAQGGDPTGTGMGGPGYEYEYEGSDLTFDKAGVVAMANTGPATPTNGSQFFITFGPAEFLNSGYTIFGQVIEGMDVVNEITRRDPEQNPNYLGDIIKTIEITEE